MEPVRDEFEWWCAYYALTEEYDRTRCSLRRGETAIPSSRHEYRDCSRNAHLTRQILGLDFAGDRAARASAERLPFDEQKRIAEESGVLRWYRTEMDFRAKLRLEKEAAR